MTWIIVEKSNHLAHHGIFDSKDRAMQFLRDVIPVYVVRSYFSDKTLTADSFEVNRGDTMTWAANRT